MHVASASVAAVGATANPASQIPRGVGACPPPGMDPRKGKLMCIKARMLDDSVRMFHLGSRATGQDLFDEACRALNLLESDYFDIEYIDCSGNRCWLDKDKSILRQINSAHSDARFFFIVKFYTPNPADLEEDYTRYLFSLQLRRDLVRGELICNESTAALLASFVVQADCGDYSAVDYPDARYLAGTRFIPNQSQAFQLKVMESHKRLLGMTPAEADLAFIETARRCDFYGIKLHAAKDVEGTDVGLSVAHMGIKVFHQLNCVATFSWAKVRKLCFKRKRLMIKIHSDSYQCYKETIEFVFEGRNECKNFWKKCVEHHSFFRCAEPQPLGKNVGKREHSLLFSRGSTFRYHGRTQKQLIDYVREHQKRREPFQRPLHVSSVNISSVPREASVAAAAAGGEPMTINNRFIPPSHSDVALRQHVNGGVGGGDGGSGGGFTIPMNNGHAFGGSGGAKSSVVAQYPPNAYYSNATPVQHVLPMRPPMFPSCSSAMDNYQHPPQQEQQQQRMRGAATRPMSVQQPPQANNNNNNEFMEELESRLANRRVVNDNGHNYLRGGASAHNQPHESQPQHQQQRFGVAAFKARNGGGGGVLPTSYQIHQQDIMSTSLPNVLATEHLRGGPGTAYGNGDEYDASSGIGANNHAAASFHHHAHHRHLLDKSASGENFFVLDANAAAGMLRNGGRQRHSQERDINEDSDGGSYKCSSISDMVSAAGGGGQHATGATGRNAPDHATLYNTTFTTKRVGDVIIKKVNEGPPSIGGGLHLIHREGSSDSGGGGGGGGDTFSGWNELGSSRSAGLSTTSSAPYGGGGSYGTTTYQQHASNAASSGNRIFVNRVRYMDGLSRLRNEIPIPIDGPQQQQQQQKLVTAAAAECRIIKPVMISERHRRAGTPAGSSFGTGGGSSSSVVAGNRKQPVIVRTTSGSLKQTTAAVEASKCGHAEETARVGGVAAAESQHQTPTNAQQQNEQSSQQQQRDETTAAERSAEKPRRKSGVASADVQRLKQQQQEQHASEQQAVSSLVSTEQPHQPSFSTSTTTTTQMTTLLKGRVITRESLVITPEGIEVRDEAHQQQQPQQQPTPNTNQSKAPPPKVPPKPHSQLATMTTGTSEIEHKKTQSVDDHATTPAATAVGRQQIGQTGDGGEPSSVVELFSLSSGDAGANSTNETKKKPEADVAVMSPLDSILSDVCSINQTLNELEHQQSSTSPHFVPPIVSVESIDRPDVKRFHMFGEVPYTLTVRSLEEHLPADQQQQKQQETTTTVVGINKHNRSLELVHRNRLPRQDSFSSQDHSISPTTPNSGNIVDYIARRRSLSNEQREASCSAADGALTESRTSASGKTSTKKHRQCSRRLTQPVNLAPAEPSSLSTEQQPTTTTTEQETERRSWSEDQDSEKFPTPPTTSYHDDADEKSKITVIEAEAGAEKREHCNGQHPPSKAATNGEREGDGGKMLLLTKF